MKKVLMLLCVALMVVQSVLAQDAGSILMGYCGEVYSRGMSLGVQRRESVAAVRFDEDFVSRFAGCRVTAIRVCLAGIVGNTAGVWLTDELPESIPYMTNPADVASDDYYKAAQYKPENFAYHFPYEAWLDIYGSDGKPDQNLQRTWQEKTLPTPYTIQADKPFYAGFRTFPVPGGVGTELIALEYDGTNGTDDHSWVYFPDSSDPWCPLAKTSFGSFNVGLMIQVRIEGESLPKNNVAMAAINGSEYMSTDEAATFECVVQNKGVNKLMSFDMTYSIDGEAQPTKTMKFQTGLEYNQYGGFRLEGIQFSEPGAHTLSITVGRPNGVDDTNESDNTLTRTLSVYSPEASLPRRVLVETFTGITCPNCPPAHEREEEALKGTDAIVVTHHSGFNPDELTHDTSLDLVWFYNYGGNSFAPAIMMDRTNVNGFYKTDYLGPVFYPGEPEGLRGVYEMLKKVPTTVDVKFEATYDAATRQLVVTAHGDVLATPAGSDHRLNVWLTESGIKAKKGQLGSDLGADYIHNNVLRAVLNSSSWGDPIDLSGDTYSRTFTTTLPAKWKPENMEIVGFLGNIDGSDPTNCRVFNAGSLRLADIDAEGVNLPTTSGHAAPAAYYSVSGQRLAAPAPGVTIVRSGNTTAKVLKP